jgi:hypothetical protein
MAHDGGRDPVGTSRIQPRSSSSRGFPAPQLDITTASFSTTASESTPSSSSRRGSLLVDPHQFRPQSLHLPSASHVHAHAGPGRARLPRRWTTSSPRADADVVRPRGTTTTAAAAAEAAGGSRPSALQRVATGFRRLTHSSQQEEAEEEEDWTVFGEVMAHEGAQPLPLPPPSPSPSPPSPSPSSRAQGSDGGLGDGVVPAVHVLVPTPVGETAAYASSIRQAQSPASDALIEDQFSLEPEGSYHDGSSSSDTGLHASHIRVESDTELPSSMSSKDAGRKDHGIGRGGEHWWPRAPTLPTLYRNILKCSLAYFLGSLFTYYPPLARFISELTQDSPGEKYPSAMGHMVATV